MIVMKKGIMPDGTPVQIEDWNEGTKRYAYGFTVGSYPKSKANHPGSFSPKYGEPFRAQFNFDSDESVNDAFDNLVSGQKTLADYKDNFDLRHKYGDCI